MSQWTAKDVIDAWEAIYFNRPTPSCQQDPEHRRMEEILKFDSEEIVQALKISHDLDNVFHILMPTNAPEDRSELRTPIVFRNNYREEVGGHESQPRSEMIRWQLS